MITLQLESFVDAYDEFLPLLELHWSEIARDKENIKLNVDVDGYRRLEELGILHVATARDEGCLIGYMISFVSPNLHYKDWLMANNDVLFIHPDHRGNGTFVRLLRFVEQDLRNMGVVNLYIHMKLAHDFGALLEKFGYYEIERVHEKKLIKE